MKIKQSEKIKLYCEISIQFCFEITEKTYIFLISDQRLRQQQLKFCLNLVPPLEEKIPLSCMVQIKWKHNIFSYTTTYI